MVESKERRRVRSWFGGGAVLMLLLLLLLLKAGEVCHRMTYCEVCGEPATAVFVDPHPGVELPDTRVFCAAHARAHREKAFEKP